MRLLSSCFQVTYDSARITGSFRFRIHGSNHAAAIVSVKTAANVKKPPSAVLSNWPNSKLSPRAN